MLIEKLKKTLLYVGSMFGMGITMPTATVGRMPRIKREPRVGRSHPPDSKLQPQTLQESVDKSQSLQPTPVVVQPPISQSVNAEKLHSDTMDIK